MPLLTTKIRTTTNFKTKGNQNCQKIEWYESLTTKKLKRKHSSRQEGGVEMGSQGREDSWQGAPERLGQATVAGGRPGKVEAGGEGGPTFACR